MRITRTQSIVAATAIIVGFIVSAVLAAKYRFSTGTGAVTVATPSPVETLATQGATPMTQAEYVLDNFQRSETKDGRKLWEIKAVRGKYSPEKQRATIEEATVWFFRKEGDQLELRALNAELTFNGTSLDRAEVSGGVHIIHNETTTADTESAVYDKIAEQIESNKPITIKNEQMQVQGTGFVLNIKDNSLRILSNVRTHLNARRKKK